MSAIGQEWEAVIADEECEKCLVCGAAGRGLCDDCHAVGEVHRRRIRGALRHYRRKQWAWRVGMTVIGAFVAWELWKIVEVNP